MIFFPVICSKRGARMLYAAVNPPELMTRISSLCAHARWGSADASAATRNVRRVSLSMAILLSGFLPHERTFPAEVLARLEAQQTQAWPVRARVEKVFGEVHLNPHLNPIV